MDIHHNSLDQREATLMPPARHEARRFAAYSQECPFGITRLTRSWGAVFAMWYCPDNGKQITNLADQLASTEKDCRLGGNRRGGPSRCVAVRPRSSNVTARTGLTKRLFATFLQDQELWRKCGKTTPVKRKKGLRADALSPFASSCRRQDLNLHSHYRNQALNLARLPIPPLRLGLLVLSRLRARESRGVTSGFYAADGHHDWKIRIRELDGRDGIMPR